MSKGGEHIPQVYRSTRDLTHHLPPLPSPTPHTRSRALIALEQVGAMSNTGKLMLAAGVATGAVAGFTTAELPAAEAARSGLATEQSLIDELWAARRAGRPTHRPRPRRPQSRLKDTVGLYPGFFSSWLCRSCLFQLSINPFRIPNVGVDAHARPAGSRSLARGWGRAAAGGVQRHPAAAPWWAEEPPPGICGLCALPHPQLKSCF